MTVSSIETRTGEWIWGPVQRGDASIDECAVAHVLLEHDTLSTRGTMIDVGAHHGSAFRRFVRDGWRVVAFEPDSVNRAVLEASTEAGWDLTIDDRALSDHPERDVSFFRSEESTGISGLSAFHESHELVDSVDLTTLAEVLIEFGVEHVHFLKIDTEGHDHRVLRGFPWHIDRPDVIVCEFEDAKLRPGSATLQAEYLLELGYNVVISEWHPVVRYGIPHDFRGLWTFEQNDQVTTAGFGNMIALRPDLASSVPAAVTTVVKQRGRLTKRAPETPDAKDPSNGMSAPATNNMAHSPSRGRTYRAIGRRFTAIAPGRLRTLISKIPSRLAGFIRWYLTPSGLLLALSLALLSLGFIIHDLYGVAGSFVLAVFIPYRFAREKGINYAVGFGGYSAYGVRGIPQGYLIGADGKVVWEGHPSSLTAAMLEAELAKVRFFPDLPYSKKFNSALASCQKKKWASALKAVDKIAEDKRATDDDRDHAGQVRAFIEGLASQRLTYAKEAIEARDYFAANELFKELDDKFGGMAEADEAATKLKEWRKDKDIKRAIDAGLWLSRGKDMEGAKNLKGAMAAYMKAAKLGEGTIYEAPAKESAQALSAKGVR